MRGRDPRIHDNCFTDSVKRDLIDLKVKCQRLEKEILEKSKTIAVIKKIQENDGVTGGGGGEVITSVKVLSKSTQVSIISDSEMEFENKLDRKVSELERVNDEPEGEGHAT